MEFIGGALDGEGEAFGRLVDFERGGMKDLLECKGACRWGM